MTIEQKLREIEQILMEELAHNGLLRQRVKALEDRLAGLPAAPNNPYSYPGWRWTPPVSWQGIVSSGSVR